MAKIRTQKDMRRAFNADDQWGRKWYVQIEKDTGDPCYLTPCFTDPLRTPTQFVRPEANASRLNIDYGRWLTQIRESRTDWERQLDETGMRLYGDAYNASQARKNMRREHRQMVGDGPLEPQLVERARDGDKELLGLMPVSEETLKMMPAGWANVIRKQQAA